MRETTKKTTSSNLVGDASNFNKLTPPKTASKLPAFLLALLLLFALSQLAGIAVAERVEAVDHV